MRPNKTEKRSTGTGSTLKVMGQVEIALCPPSIITPGRTISMQDLRRLGKGSGVVISKTHNLETQFTLNAIALSMAGAVGQIDGSTTSISPVSIAFGSGSTPVTATDTALDSELMRKYFAVSGATGKSAAGGAAIFRSALSAGEVLGQIGCLGLFGADTATSATAAGSITVGGSPRAGDVIAIAMKGRSLSPLVVGAAPTPASIATALNTLLSADGYFSALYTTTVAGAVISITSIGKGTVYNSDITVLVTPTGGTSVTSSAIAGGATPGGQLIAAANTSLQKVAGRAVVVEWTVQISN